MPTELKQNYSRILADLETYNPYPMSKKAYAQQRYLEYHQGKLFANFNPVFGDACLDLRSSTYILVNQILDIEVQGRCPNNNWTIVLVRRVGDADGRPEADSVPKGTAPRL